MKSLYELGVMGAPSQSQLTELENLVNLAVAKFGLVLGRDVAWTVQPESFDPERTTSAAVVFFGGENAPQANLVNVLKRAIPVIPVVSDPAQVLLEIPIGLRRMNCLTLKEGGVQRVATALLECASLLPRQRRVFLSYRRNEARDAALQLFDALSARFFDVFLDTHGIAPAEDFQATLWHRLCDSDVLVMLDTPGYFESRWTSAEFGRALAKGISVLRVGWPDSTPSARTATASRAEILPEELDQTTGHLANSAIDRICLQLETVRSESHAIRNLNLYSNLRIAIETIGGQVAGVGPNNAIYIELPNQKEIVVYPTVRVPTSTNLHEATTNAPDRSVAVVYDHVGLHPKWLEHIDWLGNNIRTARWVKAAEAAWQFADWEI